MSSNPPDNGNNGAAAKKNLVVVNDVYSRMLQNNVDSAIEDMVLVDEESGEYFGPCTCGQCDADSPVVDQSAGLSSVPMLYVETRIGEDPIVLDEAGVSLEAERPRVTLITDIYEPKPTADFMMSFDPATFDPFDPGIDENTDLNITVTQD